MTSGEQPELVEVSKNEESFKNYKEKQNYWKNKYKNRQKVFFGQRYTATINSNGRDGIIRRQKGRTYTKWEGFDL